MAADLAALKDWVTAADGEQFSRLPEGVVSVNISHSNITARMIELKFDLSQTVSRVQPELVVLFLTPFVSSLSFHIFRGCTCSPCPPDYCCNRRRRCRRCNRRGSVNVFVLKSVYCVVI